MQQYIPGAESPENKQMAEAADDQFKKVLEQDPKNDDRHRLHRFAVPQPEEVGRGRSSGTTS